MKLKEARANKFLTMAQLADMAGVSLYTIRNIEAGVSLPPLPVAVKIAKALEMEPAEIDEFKAARDKTIRGRATPQGDEKAS